jgi:hypothetical protein
MRKLLLWALSAGLLLGLAGGLRAQDDVRAIIEKAVKAHGGADNLAKVRAERIKAEGKLYLPDGEATFTSETTVQLPDRFRHVMQYKLKAGTQTRIEVLNRDKGWISDNGKLQELDADQLAKMKEMFYMDRVVHLSTLIKDKGYELTALKEIKVNDRAVVGVKVSSKGHKDISLYFEKDSGLLVMTEHRVGNDKKQLAQQEHYSNFKEVGGCKRPMKVVAFQDSKKLMEAEIKEVKHLDSVPDSEFAKP